MYATLSVVMATSQQSFRRKRSDTRIGTIEKQYGVDLGVRSDKKLGNYLREKGYPSLSQAVKVARRKNT